MPELTGRGTSFRPRMLSSRATCGPQQTVKGNMMNKLALAATAAAFGLTLAACDSQAENQVEQQAEAIDEAYEADADLEEAMTAGSSDEATGEATADAMREQGEETKDNLEDAADEMDATPQ